MLKLRHFVITAVIMLMTALSASAQKHIESAVDALIKKYPDAQTAYTEYRAPKTHKLERVTRIITMSDEAEYNKLLRALEADAAESVRFSKAAGVVTAKFEDDDRTASYSLLPAKYNINSGKVILSAPVFEKEDNNWLLSITIRNEAD